ncbi:alpha-(1,6)-fucosyltransferase-like isoform X2 [Tachypleus tridentatus]|uniref:alpha-(1,6)-fucosyltransferase-like isoform X2 n=1 Tax=Tachypleus tridentatus TaxID=6853 RepID=UPI003FD5E906
MEKKRLIAGIVAVDIALVFVITIFYVREDNFSSFYRFKETTKDGLEKFLGKCSINKYLLDNDEEGVPSLQSENSRRQAIFAVNELWYYFISRTEILRKRISNLVAKALMRKMMDNMGHFRRVILLEVNKMSHSDKREIWRENEMKGLSDLVQKRIYVLQNPQTCELKRTLICNLTNPNGFASGIHDVLWCFVKAYHTNRTLFLISKHWHYAPDEWNSVFHPLSPVCHKLKNIKNKSNFPGENDDNSRSLMGALPSDIASRLMLAHGKPLAWWYGQFLKYILRPQEGILKNVQMVRKLGYDHPIVGIHVRRTDKIGNEASFHSIEKYMLHVDDFYKRLELVEKVNVRRVFVATDDPKVLIECKKKSSNGRVPSGSFGLSCLYSLLRVLSSGIRTDADTSPRRFIHGPVTGRGPPLCLDFTPTS